MKKIIRLSIIFILFFLSSVGFFFFEPNPTLSQGRICTGSVTSNEYNCQRNPITRRYSCRSNGSFTQSCSGGGVEYCMVATSGGCSATSSGCNVTTNTVGCSSYTPPVVAPPPVVPPPGPSTPAPSGGGGGGGGGSNESYICNPCSGTCQQGPGGSSIQACQASCYILPPDDPQCVIVDPGGGDPNAGASSCPEIEENTTSDIVKPGETKTWFTWAPPPGNTAQERLQNVSNSSTTISYTSPGDKITAVYMFQIPESEPHSFYVYDSADETFYFLAHDNKPPVVFSRSQEVVDNAVKLGYTLIENPNGSAESKNAAKAIDKRVYKLVEDGNPWKFPSEQGGGKRGVTHHAPYGEGLRHIPYVNCASLFNASGHRGYFSTDIVTLKNQDDYCFQRQYIPLRFPQDEEEDEFTGQYVAGNYLGLEEDIKETRLGIIPEYTPDIFGYDGSGDIIWPRTGILVGPRWEYFDNFEFAFLETKEKYLQRSDDRFNSLFKPGFMRQAILQIPTDLLVSDEEHNFHAYIGHGVPHDSTPVQDEGGSQNCAIETDDDVCDASDGEDCSIKDDYDEIPAKCENFSVVNTSTGQVVSPGGKIRIGDTYTIYSNAQNDSTLYDFYNNSFDQPNVTGATAIEHWDTSPNINTFEVVDCGANCIQRHPDDPEIGDTKVLRASQVSGSQNNNGIHTTYIDTGANVTGKTFQVEFWARVEGSTSKTLSDIILERDRYYPPTASQNYVPIFDPSDSRSLRFPVENTLNSTTNSITVTNQWKPFIGTVTFTYDTDNQSGHPRDSEATKIKLILKAPSDGTKILYDNVKIVGWNQPTVYYRMASALTPAQSPSFNQCSQSTHAGPTFTNLSGGFFWSNITIPEDRTPGRYNIFAAMEAYPGKVYFGNPNATTNCNLDRDVWDDFIADKCSIEVELIACEDITPALPSVIRVEGSENTLPNTPNNSLATRFNDFRITDNNLEVVARANGNSSVASAVTSMTMYIDPYNTNNPSISEPSEDALPIEGTAIGSHADGSPQFSFTYNIEQLYTNEISIFLQAVNSNACNESGELVSGWYKRNIRLLRQRSGYLIEVPREQITTYACTETSDSLGAGHPRLINTSDARFTNTRMTVSAIDTFSTYITQPTSDINDSFKKLFRSPVTGRYTTDLPYNPPNNTAWRNQISTAILEIPQLSEEETYVCVDRCNPDASNASYIRCAIPGEDIPKASTQQFSNDLNVYVAKGSFSDAWWQARGGLIYANGNIQSSLPLFNGNPRQLCQDHYSDDVCMPFIGAKALGSGGNLNSHITGSVLIQNGASSTVDPASWATQNTGGQLIAGNAQTVANNETYSYYHDLIDENKDHALASTMPTNFTNVITSSSLYDANDNLVIFQRDGDLSINLSTTSILVPSNRKVLVFVSGNLNIFDSTDQDRIRRINVDPGGFLGFVVNGNIIIDSNVGHSVQEGQPVPTAPVIEGVYFAQQQIRINSKGTEISDKKFIGEGSFIGLGGVQLNRKFDSGETNPFDREKNSYSPVEQFIFSPSLIARTPNFLREADLTWQEVN